MEFTKSQLSNLVQALNHIPLKSLGTVGKAYAIRDATQVMQELLGEDQKKIDDINAELTEALKEDQAQLAELNKSINVAPSKEERDKIEAERITMINQLNEKANPFLDRINEIKEAQTTETVELHLDSALLSPVKDLFAREGINIFRQRDEFLEICEVLGITK